MKEKEPIKQVRKKTNKKITLSEFRAWLSGVEEMQNIDWCPSKDQWNTIRDKIDLIEEPKFENFNPGMTRQEPGRPVISTPNFNGFNETQSRIPETLIPNIQVPPELQSKLLEIQINPSLPGLSSGGDRMKTPDIDTQNGFFSSSFE